MIILGLLESKGSVAVTEEQIQSAEAGNAKKKVSLAERYRKLPSGVQRLIIGIIVIVLLVAANFVRDMISVEEELRVEEKHAHDK
jgi:uncharacterized membrane protein